MQIRVNDKSLPDILIDTKDKGIIGVISNDNDYFFDYLVNNYKNVCYINEVFFYTDVIYDECLIYLNKNKHVYKNVDSKMIKMMNIIGIDSNKIHSRISLLSNGERKLLFIGVHLLMDSSIYIFKDLSLFLDSFAFNRIKNVLIELVKKYNKTIFISDSSDIIINICDNLLLFNRDKYIFDNCLKIFSSDLSDFSCNLPEIIKIVNVIKERNKNFNYSKDIRDLIKDVYKYVK